MHDDILGAIGFAVPLLLLAWYANRIHHPERSWQSAFLILLGGVAFFLAQVWALVFSGFARAAMRSRRSLWGAFPPG